MGVTRAYVEAGSKAFVRGQRYAYVPYLLQDALAGRNGVTRTFDPRPGDLVTFDWDGGGVPDHVELVDKPPRTLTVGTSFTTVGCNTSFDEQGSQSNGGACAQRTRTVLDGKRTVFIRVTA
jgi:cell wall-associated NlpC family hydrolase